MTDEIIKTSKPDLLDALRELKDICQNKWTGHDGDDEILKAHEILFQLRDELEKQKRESGAIAQIKDSVNAGLTLSEILDRAFDSFREVIPYNRIGFALIDESGKYVRTHWARSDSSDIRIAAEYSAPLEGSSLQKIIQTGAPRIINDLMQYLQEHPDSESTKKIVSEGMRSSLTCPLFVGQRPIGFLFFSSMNPQSYENAHVAFFQEVAQQLSLTIEKGRLYQELADLNETKNKILGIAAHDLRNPIGVIKGFAELIQDGTFGPITEEQRNAILRIIKNCDSMLAIINDLLDITTIEAGKLDLHLQKSERAKYLSDFLSEAKILAQAKDIEIILETPPDLPDVIMDPQRIEQALNNLVSNAVKFSYPGSIVKITAAKTDNSISISVQDQGQGIFESEIPLLFTDYAKGSARPTAGEKSTGLGLAIVRRILRAHDGSMDVKSKAGKGSTFTITLPIQGPKQSTTPIK